MSGNSRILRSPHPFLVATLCLAFTACEIARDRPSGPTDPLSGVITFVMITQPAGNSIVAADSAQVVIVQAEGEVRAVEYVLMRASSRDTVAGARRQFRTVLSSVAVPFGVRIPGLQTGERLEFRGVAEDAGGERYWSEPVRVTVVECDRFPEQCEGG